MSRDENGISTGFGLSLIFFLILAVSFVLCSIVWYSLCCRGKNCLEIVKNIFCQEMEETDQDCSYKSRLQKENNDHNDLQKEPAPTVTPRRVNGQHPAPDPETPAIEEMVQIENRDLPDIEKLWYRTERPILSFDPVLHPETPLKAKTSRKGSHGSKNKSG